MAVNKGLPLPRTQEGNAAELYSNEAAMFLTFVAQEPSSIGAIPATRQGP